MKSSEEAADPKPDRPATDEDQSVSKAANIAPSSTKMQTTPAKERQQVNPEPALNPTATANIEAQSEPPAGKQNQTAPVSGSSAPAPVKTPPDEPLTPRSAGAVPPAGKTPAAAKEDQQPNPAQRLKKPGEAEAVTPSQPASGAPPASSPPGQPAQPVSGDAPMPPAMSSAADRDTQATRPNSLVGQKLRSPAPAEQPAPAQPVDDSTGSQPPQMQPTSRGTSPPPAVNNMAGSAEEGNRGQDLQPPISPPTQTAAAPPAGREAATQSPFPTSPAPAQPVGDSAGSQPPQVQPASRGTSPPPAMSSVVGSEGRSQEQHNLGQHLKSPASPPEHLPLTQPVGDNGAAQSTSPPAQRSAPAQPVEGVAVSSPVPPSSQSAPTPLAGNVVATPSMPVQPASREADPLPTVNRERQVEGQRTLGQQLKSPASPPQSESQSASSPPGQPAPPQPGDGSSTASPPPSQPTQPASGSVFTLPVMSSTTDPGSQTERPHNLGQQLKSSTPSSQPVPAQSAGADVTAQSTSSSAQQPAPAPPVDRETTVQPPVPASAQPTGDSAAPQATLVQPVNRGTAALPQVAADESQAGKPGNLGQQLRSTSPPPAANELPTSALRPNQPTSQQPVGRGVATQSSPPDPAELTQPVSDSAAPQLMPTPPAGHGVSTPPTANNERQTEGQPDLGRQLRSSASSPKQTSLAQQASDDPTPHPPPVQPASRHTATLAATNSKRQAEEQANPEQQLKSSAPPHRAGRKAGKESK